MGAREPPEVPEPAEVLAGPVPLDGLDERQVGREEVEIDGGRHEVQSVVAVGHAGHRSEG